MNNNEDQTIIPPHGGYRKLLSYQMAPIVYDATVVFCARFIDKISRTHDQMVQAARSGKQKYCRRLNGFRNIKKISES
jgi:hypothetical protein